MRVVLTQGPRHSHLQYILLLTYHMLHTYHMLYNKYRYKIDVFYLHVFFIGLQPLYEITKVKSHTLRVDLEDWDGFKVYAQYS